MVYEELGQTPGIHLTEPVSYRDLLGIMSRCYLILTDSGGIQEEAVSFHKPVLVLRNTTERPEGVAAGAAKLVGTEPQRIVGEAVRLLDDRAAYAAMASVPNPYGDGRAAARIAGLCCAFLHAVR